MKIENISFRAVELKDIDRIYAWENDYQLWNVSSSCQKVSYWAVEQYVYTTQNENIFSSGQARFMIDTVENNEVITIGCIDLFDLDPQHQRAGIGIFVEEKYRGHNIATEAINWLFDYAINILNIHQLYAFVPIDNIASQKAFENCDFLKTVCLKDWVKRGSKFLDVVVYQKNN